jgi:Icc-related predicted phosphoesterase
MNDPSTTEAITLAAIGDLHVTETCQNRYRDLFVEISDQADVLALCGDLTNFGKIGEAEVLAEDLRHCTIPIVGVLGNHDYECGVPDEVTKIFQEAGVRMLGEQATMVDGVGFAGVKGFVGGFAQQWANFGEPLFREAYAETTRDVDGLEQSLAAIDSCAIRIALLHYSPVEATLVGEPERLWLVLGADRLAGPIRRHLPQVVVHGHAHHGSFEGEIDGVPVYNVAVHVTGRNFWTLELSAGER